MAKDNPLKNVFNEMPTLEAIKKDLKSMIKYYELKKSSDTNPNELSANKPVLFNDRRQLKLPQKNYNNSPIKINITVDKKLEKLSVTVIAKLNKVAPEYKGVQEETVKNILRDNFNYNDFYKLIERCIANFELSNPDDFETIEQVIEKAGVESLDEFLEQIYVTDEFKQFLDMSDKKYTIKDLSKTINDMVSSRKYGLPYFVSMMVSKTSPDGFKYSEIAEDIINNLT